MVTFGLTSVILIAPDADLNSTPVFWTTTPLEFPAVFEPVPVIVISPESVWSMEPVEKSMPNPLLSVEDVLDASPISEMLPAPLVVISALLEN